MKKIMLLSALLAVSATVSAQTYNEAFETHRAMYGKGHSFTWEGKQYTTDHPEELEAKVEANQANAEDLIAKARAENEKANAVGFEWKLTRDILKEAEQAVAEGQYQKALNLAAQAKYHARIGIEQHALAERDWQNAVPQ